MKKNGRVRISVRTDLGVLLALCILQAVTALIQMINLDADVVWGTIFAVSVAVSIVCLLGMRIGLTVDTENREIIRKTLFKTTKIDFIRIRTVKVEKVFLGKAITIIGDDGKVFDKTRFILYKENYIVPENFVAYFSTGCYDRDLLLPSKKLEKECARSSKISLAIIAIVQLAILVPLAIIDVSQAPEYPIVDIKLYGYGHFWVIAGITVLTLIGLFVKNRHRGITDFIILLLFFGFLPAALFAGLGTNEDYYVSYTDDFANYDEIIAEKWDDGDSYFPTEIDGEVVDFSYYYKYFWDSITEIYLEVKYDDEEYARISDMYKERESSYFGSQYEEVNLVREWFNVEEGVNVDLYISHAYIEKIVFDKENNTVIYYYLSVTDPFYLEWCHLVKKFDIDLEGYEKYIEEKDEEKVEGVNFTLQN